MLETVLCESPSLTPKCSSRSERLLADVGGATGAGCWAWRPTARPQASRQRVRRLWGTRMGRRAGAKDGAMPFLPYTTGLLSSLSGMLVALCTRRCCSLVPGLHPTQTQSRCSLSVGRSLAGFSNRTHPASIAKAAFLCYVDTTDLCLIRTL